MSKKLKMLALSFVLGCSLLTSISVQSSKSVSVIAEEEVTESIDTSSLDNEETSLLDSTKEWFSHQWDNLVMPLLLAFTSTNVIVFIASFITLKVKEKSINKKNEQSQKCIDQMTAFVETQSKIFNNLIQSNELSVETKNLLQNNIDTLRSSISNIESKMDSIEQIKPILSILISIQNKIALCSDSVIKAGLGNDLKQLENMVKELLNEKTHPN